MRNLLLCIALAALLALATAAQASWLTIPVESVQFSLLRWQPLDGSPALTCPTVAANLFKRPVDPARLVATPTNLDEIVPWAKQNLQVDLAFQFKDYATLDFAGGGFSESARVAQVMSVPVKVGAGYLMGGPSWCWYWGGSLEF